jgi:hypothetical protein
MKGKSLGVPPDCRSELRPINLATAMNDQDTIKAAYSDSLKVLYNTFFGAFAAAVDQAGKDAALARFKLGVTHARQARDAALGVL